MNKVNVVEIRERAHTIIKRNKRSNLKFRLILSAFVVVLVSMFLNVYQHQEKLLEMKNSETILINSKIINEQARSKELLHWKENLNSDEMVEKEAREKFDMVRPGERVFVDVNR